jgi:hypothetical protein
VRTPGFVGRPRRPGRLQGVINGQTLEMHDFTPEQYDTLERLTAALCRALRRFRVSVHGASVNSIASDRPVVWLLLLCGSRYQSWA